MTETEKLKAKIKSLERSLKDANSEVCELCERLGENICKDGGECDRCYWKE